MEKLTLNDVLGMSVRCAPSGLVGHVDATGTWRDGRQLCLVQPPVDSHGRLPESQWLPLGDLSLTKVDE